MKASEHDKLAEKLRQAIEDSIITTAEYEDIINTASEIDVLSSHDRAILRQFNCMIADGTLRRVPSL